MKIKVDYVTNSSSEIFGVVLGDAGIVGALMAALLGIFKGCAITVGDSDSESQNGGGGGGGGGRPVNPHAETDSAIEDAESMAQQIAAAALEDAIRQDEIVKDAYAQAQSTLDSAQAALNRELDECRKTWADSEKTADKSDPGYTKLKAQYDDYMDYLKTQIDQTNYQKQMIDYDKAVKQAEADAKNEWVKQRQADYIAVKEETAMLEAVSRGYNVPGYDTAAVKDRLKQLSERENEISKTLADNNASINYTAADRGSIGPSAESKALNDKIRAEKAAFEAQKKTADAKKRVELEKEMNKNIEEYKTQMTRANRFDMATKAAEGVQFGADIAVEGLATVTGPAGQQIKLAYTAGKAVAGGMGEGMADPKNAAKHLAKGILNAGTEVLKDKFGSDKPWQAAATSILNEGLQGGLDASIKGEGTDAIIESMGKGLTKGVFDAGTDKALDAIKDKLPIPKGSSVEIGDYSVSKVLNNNPLTKGVIRTTVREAGGSKVKDAIKGEIVDGIGKKSGFADDE